MGWMDAPIVEDDLGVSAQPKWMSAPLVDEPASVASTLSDVDKSARAGLRSGTEAMLGLPGDVASGVEWLGRKMGEYAGADPKTASRIGHAVGLASPSSLGPYLTSLLAGRAGPTTTADVKAATVPLLGERYKPQTTPGEYAHTVGEFIPAALTGPGGAGRNIATKLGSKAMMQGVLPGLASETAGQLTEGTAAEPYARVGGALAGGLAGGGLERWNEGFKFPVTPRSELVDAAKRLDIKVPAAAMPDAKLSNLLAGKLAELPIVGYPLQRSSRNLTEKMGNKVSELSNIETDRQLSGLRLSESLRDWTDGEGVATAVDKLYNRVDKHIDPNVTRPLTNTIKVAKEMNEEAQRSTSKSSLSALNYVSDALERPEGLDYAGLKRLRTDIGAQISGKITPAPGTSEPALKRLYASLTEDLKDTIKASGGERAVANWEHANKASSELADKRKLLATILGIKGDAPEGAVFSRIVSMAQDGAKGSVQRLKEVRRSLTSDTWDEFTSTVISEMGRDASRGSAYFSPDKFRTAYAKYNDRAKDVVFGKNKQTLDDIFKLSNALKNTTQWGNPSGTASALSTVAAGGTLMYSPLLVLAGVTGGTTVSAILARRASATRLRDWLAAMAAKAATAAPDASRTAIFAAQRELAKEIATETGERKSEVEARLNAYSTSYRGDLPSGPNR